MDEEAAVEGAEHRAAFGDGGDGPDGHAPPVLREGVVDDRDGRRHEGAAPHGLHHAGQDDPGEAFGDGDQRRTAHEDEHRHRVDATVAVDVGDAPHERHGRGEADQVAGDDPGALVQVADRQADVEEDAGESGDDNRLVERGNEDAGARQQQQGIGRRLGRTGPASPLARIG